MIYCRNVVLLCSDTPAAQMCADVCRSGSWEGEPLMMPLLTHYDAAACSPLRSASPVLRPAPPASLSSCFACFGSDNGSDGCAPVAASWQQNFSVKRCQRSRSVLALLWFAESRAGRCGTMRLETVLRLFPCVVFLHAMRAQTGKFTLKVQKLWVFNAVQELRAHLMDKHLVKLFSSDADDDDDDCCFL